MKTVLIIGGAVIVLLLATLGVMKFMDNGEQVVVPEAPAPVAPKPTEEQLTGNYTEPIAQKFAYVNETSGVTQEIAVDKVAVSGLNKSQATVTYVVTSNLLGAPKWILKRVRLFNVPNATPYPMKLQKSTPQGKTVTMNLTATVPAGALLNNQVALSVSAPNGGNEVTLLHQVPPRARPLPVTATPEPETTPAPAEAEAKAAKKG